MLYGKNKLNEFKTKLTARTLDVALYEEMASLFNVYVQAKYALDDAAILALPSMQLVHTIAQSFYQSVDTESLLFVYPTKLKSHLLYYLVQDLQRDDVAFSLLKKLYESALIQDNEWIAGDWVVIESLYAVCTSRIRSPILTSSIRTVDNLLAYVETDIALASTLQRMWADILVEELHEARSTRSIS